MYFQNFLDLINNLKEVRCDLIYNKNSNNL